MTKNKADQLGGIPAECGSGVRLKVMQLPASYPEGWERPRAEGECREFRDCCPLVGCRWNSFLDVNEDTGRILFRHPGAEDPTELEFSTCTIEWAEGGATLEQAGMVIGGGMGAVSRERVRQIEQKALVAYRAALARDEGCEMPELGEGPRAPRGSIRKGVLAYVAENPGCERSEVIARFGSNAVRRGSTQTIVSLLIRAGRLVSVDGRLSVKR